METNLCEPLLDGSVLPPTVLADASAAAAVSDATPAPFEWRVADDLIERRTYGYRCPKHDPNPEDEISVDSLLGLTYREYEKRREYCALIVYFFGIVMLCFICFANRVDFIALRSNYFVQQSILQLADFKDFNGIESYTDYYDWLEKAMANTFAITPGNRSTPIGFALIRQLRIETDSSCQDSTIKKFGFLGSARCVQQSNRLTLPFPSKGIVLDPQSPFVASASNFTSAYDLDESTYKTYTYQWVSNQVNPDPVNAAPVSGIFTGLSASEYQYEVRLPYYSIDPTVNRSAQAQSVIRTMRLNGFFDVNTAAIGVDMLFFHPTLTRYSMVTFMVEQLPSGLLYPTYTGSTYKLVKMGGSVANLTFAADIFVFLFLIFQIVELAHRIKQRYGILGNLFTASMSNQHVLSAASIGCFIAVMVYRLQLWIIFESLNFSPAPASELTYPKVAPAQGEMMRKMSSAAAVGETSYQWFAVALIPMALKVLLYFKDVKGFNVIHKTLLHGRRDLLTVFCVVFAGIAFFALSGNVFFGGVDSTFLTATVSFATLVRELVSADPGLVTNLVNLEPRVGSLYFSLFFVSMWLVLLNFVLGIIVSGVTTAVAEMNDVSTATSESVKDVFKKYYALRTTEFKSHRPPSRAAFLAQTALVPVLPSPWKRIRMAFEFQTTLYLVVKRVKEFGDETPTIKRKKAEMEVLKNLDIIDPKMKSRLFDAALEDVSAQVAATSAMERGAVELWKTIDACYNAALALEGRPADLDDDATTREMAQRLWGSQNAVSSHVSTYGASIYAITSGVGGSSSVMNQSSMNRSVDGLPRPPRFNLKHNRRRGI